jgi:hypothetical protein
MGIWTRTTTTSADDRIDEVFFEAVRAEASVNRERLL